MGEVDKGNGTRLECTQGGRCGKFEQNTGVGLQKGGELVPTPGPSRGVPIQLYGTRFNIERGF